MTDTIVVERSIDAPPSVVYAYLTDSEKWARWQGVSATIAAEPGGVFGISMPNGSSARGEFIDLIPNQRVVFTWGWVDHPVVPPGSTTVTIELSAEGPGTLLRLTHSGLPLDEIPTHTDGWNHYLPRLAKVSEGSEPEPDRIPS